MEMIPAWVWIILVIGSILMLHITKVKLRRRGLKFLQGDAATKPFTGSKGKSKR